jgi:hypothetical protein
MAREDKGYWVGANPMNAAHEHRMLIPIHGSVSRALDTLAGYQPEQIALVVPSNEVVVEPCFVSR